MGTYVAYNNDLSDSLKKIARAIKIKTLKSKTSDGLENVKIKFSDFESEIMSIDVLQPMTLYPEEITNNSTKVNQIIKTANSYYEARVNGADKFKYSDDANLLNGSKAMATVRDSDGNCLLDCSAFVSLCLRGIAYDSSPFATKNEGELITTWNKSDIVNRYNKNYTWIFSCLDKQPEGQFNNFGIKGYSSIKNAAAIGEFFYKYGYIVFDVKRDGTMTETLAPKVKAGDLIFWSKPGAKENQKMRFRQISHVAIMVSDDEYCEVTGSSEVVQKRLLKDNIAKKPKNYIELICRPIYK